MIIKISIYLLNHSNSLYYYASNLDNIKTLHIHIHSNINEMICYIPVIIMRELMVILAL